MAVYALDIINEASILLGDESNIRWSKTELLGYLNDGQLQSVTLEPKSNPARTAVQLVTGIKQSLPADGILLLDIFYNMGSAGSAPQGSAITVVNVDVLSKRIPTWMTDAANGLVSCYMYDEKDPQHYNVWPPQPSPAWWIEINYSAVPATIPNYNIGTEITINEYWKNALLNFVMFRATSKDTEVPAELAAKSQQYFELFKMEITQAAEIQNG